MLESGIINDKIKKVFESDSFDKENLTHLREVKKISEENKKTATFLKHLFSADGTYTETIHGCGFYYDKTPELFMQFFLSNSAIFCMEKQNREIFQKAVAYGNSTNVDEIFEEFTDVNGETGTGAVLAYIMRALSGKQFFYYPSNEESMGCILCEYTNEKSSHERIPDDMLYETYKVAKELEIPEIGMVYFTYLLNKYTDQVYKTDSIYYNFKEN